MASDYVVCMTTHPGRVKNLPRVIESLMKQTVPPLLIIVTVASAQYDEMKPVLVNLPGIVTVYVVPYDNKVWKKFLYAMDKMLPGQIVLTVDDDKLYPRTMAERMLKTLQEENRPVAGNTYRHNGLKCHCGACSLVWPAMFKGWRQFEKNFERWESSDMFYTMLAADNGFDYVEADEDYQRVAVPYNEGVGYSKPGMVQRTYLSVGHALKWF